MSKLTDTTLRASIRALRWMEKVIWKLQARLEVPLAQLPLTRPKALYQRHGAREKLG